MQQAHPPPETTPPWYHPASWPHTSPSYPSLKTTACRSYGSSPGATCRSSQLEGRSLANLHLKSHDPELMAWDHVLKQEFIPWSCDWKRTFHGHMTPNSAHQELHARTHSLRSGDIECGFWSCDWDIPPGSCDLRLKVRGHVTRTQTWIMWLGGYNMRLVCPRAHWLM